MERLFCVNFIILDVIAMVLCLWVAEYTHKDPRYSGWWMAATCGGFAGAGVMFLAMLIYLLSPWDFLLGLQ